MSELTATDTEAIRAFVAREARLADENRYADWEALWADDAQCLYWVPAEDGSPDTARVAYINDNRTRLRSRVKQ
ncbi:MAG TPA: aromatic-ring-hydroxylating dioxygenase subunit beta, partial [Acidimicrobiia bacterium]|nr:aromatic-ring-hydroxylating dioxygenase subunit beta [Acidimicrobiia bacterium]